MAFSPHTRGWPVRQLRGAWRPCGSPRTRGDGPAESGTAEDAGSVLPAHAGMARLTRRRPGKCASFSPHTRGWPGLRATRLLHGERSPRTRGDGPAQHRQRPRHSSSSPRTRGDGPGGRGDESRPESVLPAHAGMARCTCVGGGTNERVLPAHAGMARISCIPTSVMLAFSPHTRGWPALPALGADVLRSSPRTRGDGPPQSITSVVSTSFSPHTRGWPDAAPPDAEAHQVLPAHAGMAREMCDLLAASGRSPRTRGDGPGWATCAPAS